jgi:hypothetical protein
MKKGEARRRGGERVNVERREWKGERAARRRLRRRDAAIEVAKGRFGS